MRIAVLGAGSWGTTVASLLAGRHDCTVWARDPELAREIYERDANSRYLPPVLIQVPGGAWTTGNKQVQAYPLMSQMIERGWICVPAGNSMAGELHAWRGAGRPAEAGHSVSGQACCPARRAVSACAHG